MPKKSNNNVLKTSVITSSKSAAGWIAFEDEMPAPFMDILLYSTKNQTFRVGYWDPVEEKVALSTVPFSLDVPEELIPFTESILEFNPSLQNMTHWSYLPLQPTSDISDIKTIGELLDVDENSEDCHTENDTKFI